MTQIKRRGGVTSTGPLRTNLRGEVYHQNIDDVKQESEGSYNSKQQSQLDETEAEFDRKSQELHELVKSYDACGFGVRINHLSKKFGVSKEVLKQIRKEVLEEIKNGYDRRASLLVEDTEPYDKPFSMKEALDLIYSTIKRYIVADESLLVRATLWIAHTYFIDELFISPICLVTSPQSNCGKSLLTTIMLEMCHHSFPISANMTEAALFRIIEECTPTIALDEADLNLQKHPEIQALLNAGHMRSTAWAFRCEPNNAYVEKFQTFCPKIISGIRSTQIRDTLTNRSIILSMRRKRKNESCESFLYTEARAVFAEIRKKVKRASIDVIDSGAFDMTRKIEWPEWMDDGRARDNWNPLFHIALAAEGGWLERAIEASRDDDETLAQIDFEKQLLGDLMEIFEENDSDAYTTSDLVDALLKKNADWRYAHQGQAINTRWLSLRLASYNLKSVRTRINGTQVRVYTKHDMQKAFADYIGLEDAEPETPNTHDNVEISKAVENIETLKANLETASNCLNVVKKLKDKHVKAITPKDLTELLADSKWTWKPNTRSGAINCNWLKKKLATLGIQTTRRRVKQSQIRCYVVSDLIETLQKLINKLELEIARLRPIPVVIE